MPKKDFYQVSLKVILKNNKDEILVLNADPKGSYAGYYDLPGGRIDDNEFTIPYAQIIQREILEELGNAKISVNPKPVAIGRHLIPAAMSAEKKDLHVFYVFFEANLISGDIKISDEHIGFRWINLDEQEPSKLFKSGTLEGINMYFNNKFINN